MHELCPQCCHNCLSKAPRNWLCYLATSALRVATKTTINVSIYSTNKTRWVEQSWTLREKNASTLSEVNYTMMSWWSLRSLCIESWHSISKIRTPSDHKVRRNALLCQKITFFLPIVILCPSHPCPEINGYGK